MNNANQRESRINSNFSSNNNRLPLINGGGMVLNNLNAINNINSMNNLSNQFDYGQKRTQSRSNENQYTGNKLSAINSKEISDNNNFSTPSDDYFYLNNNIIPPTNIIFNGKKTENFNKPINSLHSPENFTFNNQIDYILQEVASTKRLVKNVLENHTVMQSKIIEYNKIIQEQEKILRLNNIKLNEHDLKLTEILIEFNNFLNLNEKTNRIINDLTNKTEEFTKKSEFTELKSFFYNSNKNNETKIFDSLHKIDDLNVKTSEIRKEQELLQKYTLDKLKSFQSEIVENRLQQQQNLIQLEESKETKHNQQLDQLKVAVKMTENNLVNESVYRKNMIESLSREINSIINKNEEKILNLEKNQLECEKKLIGINKDYISTFQELITKNNEKYEIESKTMKSIFDLNLKHLENQLEEIKKFSDSSVFELKSQIFEIKNVTTHQEILKKEIDEKYENKIKQNISDIELLKTKTQMIHESFNEFMKENLEVIDLKINSKISSYERDFSIKLNEISTNWQILENQFFNSLTDINEKFEMLNKIVNEFQSENNFSKNSENFKNFDNIDIILFEKKNDEKFENLQKNFLEFDKKIVNYFKQKIDEIKKNIFDDQNNILKEVCEKLEMKINLLKRDIETEINENDIIREGRIQEYIVESEDRIRKKLELRINKLLEEIEKINIKLISSELGKFSNENIEENPKDSERKETDEEFQFFSLPEEKNKINISLS